jgi:integrase
MRRGEILAIRRGDIDVRNSLLFIPETKNGQSRIIPLTAEALEILQAQLAKLSGKSDRDLVFPMSANCLRLAWERVRRRAKSDDLHFHDLRHEALSRLFEKGLTTPEVQLISGHRDARMLFRYAHAERKTIAAKLAVRTPITAGDLS